MLLDPTKLSIFIGAAIALLLTPGPAVLFIVARSLEQGRKAGLYSIVGVMSGSVVHILAAAFGLSAILLQSALAFTAVKYVGAAYLVYLGIKTLRSEAKPPQVEQVEKLANGRIVRQGFIVNLFNPKSALFMFAFLPQFVSPERGSVVAQILLLGAIFISLAFLSDSMYALIAGTARDFLAGNLRMAKLQKNVAGTIYIGLGLLTAVSGNAQGK